MMATEFWHGIHLPNDQSMPDLGLIQRARFNAAKAFDFTPDEVLQRVVHECGIRNWVVRIWWAGQPPGPCAYLDAKVDRLAHILAGPLAGCSVVVEVHNEPNHVARVEGWGPEPEMADKFRLWYMAVLWNLRAELRQRIGWMPTFCFPGLANGFVHRDVEWYDRCGEAVHASEYVGVHVYWQGDHHLDLEWGLRYERYWLFRNRMLITEYGDSSFQNLVFDASPAARARRIGEWLGRVRGSGVRGAFYFILGGTGDWRGFWLDEATADAMAAVV